MDNILKHKGYIGSVNFDADDRIFHGRVMGLEDVIGFEGSTVNELEQDFHNAVDDYLETCHEIGKKPEISKNLFCYEALIQRPYQDELLKALQDPSEAAAYLNAALESNSDELFFLALQNVAQAQGITAPYHWGKFT